MPINATLSDMWRLLFHLLALFALIIAFGLVWQDFMHTDSPSMALGQLWFDLSPQSLQLAQSVTERYIDPCGLFAFMGCSPFIWYPFVAGLLQWPAALFFGIVSIIAALIAQFMPRLRTRRRHFSRDGR